MKISEIIKSARKRQGLTLEALAKQVDVSKAAVSDWENDKYVPTGAKTIMALEKALKLRWGALYSTLAEDGDGERKDAS